MACRINSTFFFLALQVELQWWVSKGTLHVNANIFLFFSPFSFSQI